MASSGIGAEAPAGIRVRRLPQLRKFVARAGSLLRHPLVIAVLAAAFSALLIPQITQQWQDRQREQDLKQSLLEEISTSSTSAIRDGISLADARLGAAGGQRGENSGDVYLRLRNAWLVERAAARSRILVYFPRVYDCWYSYERALADFLSLATSGRRSDLAARAARIRSLQRYIGSDFARSYVDPAVRDGCASLSTLPPIVRQRFQQLKAAAGWTALGFPTDTPRFRGVYAIVGEELEIAMERIVETIVRTPAVGFSHGI